jgi:hypothetical protein
MELSKEDLDQIVEEVKDGLLNHFDDGPNDALELNFNIGDFILVRKELIYKGDDTMQDNIKLGDTPPSNEE